ncbi:MAG: orotate phosphoribosyltransferase [Burkholderiales bacterium]|nr:orotate phosphoribosyltransferase [Burkholderiales bacterium]
MNLLNQEKHEELILALYDKQMIKFGHFTLKSGHTSYIYADIRTAIAYPAIFRAVCDIFYAQMYSCEYDFICGVAYSALTFASGIAYAHQIPMLLKRKEAKEYGTQKVLEGVYKANQKVLIIEDVVTSGASILETTGVLEDNHLIVKDICFLIDRNQGGASLLKKMGYNVHYIIDIKNIIEVLYKNNKITDKDRKLAIESLVQV